MFARKPHWLVALPLLIPATFFSWAAFQLTPNDSVMEGGVYVFLAFFCTWNLLFAMGLHLRALGVILVFPLVPLGAAGAIHYSAHPFGQLLCMIAMVLAVALLWVLFLFAPSTQFDSQNSPSE